MPLLSEKNKGFGEGKIYLLLAIPFTAVILAALYLTVRIILFMVSDYVWYEKIIAFFFLLAEAFVLMHGIGYFQEILRVFKRKKSFLSGGEEEIYLNEYPPVAVIITSFKEPLEVVEKTVTCFYNLTYPNKYLYFLDDTRSDIPGGSDEEAKKYRAAVEELCKRLGIDLFRRKWRGAKAGIINDFIKFTEGAKDENFKFYNYSGRKQEKPKYILIFDADQNPFPDFAGPLVAKMEKEPKLAFIQTPQYYTNFEKNRVARVAGYQQAVFYEYISEGKSIEEAMFACGTNIIIRYDALLDIGGFDENTVTEDFAASLKLHLQGWKSAYSSKPMAFGMGPENLDAYFKQQGRWAHGTISLFKKIAAEFFKNPFKLPLGIWTEYFLSSTYYFIGIVFLILLSCPIVYLLFNIPSYFVHPDVYIAFFVPYFILSLFVFFWALRHRNYSFGDLLLGQFLIGITAPVYAKAAVSALLGIKRKFAVTSKSGSGVSIFKIILPQLFLAFLCFIAFAAGLYKLFSGNYNTWALLINMFWCAYHLVLLSMVVYFNNPEEK